jgi:hypothetical protein
MAGEPITFLRHVLAAIAYRGAKTLRDAPAGFVRCKRQTGHADPSADAGAPGRPVRRRALDGRRREPPARLAAARVGSQ